MSTKEDLIKKIKLKGYWEINIHPEIYKDNRIDKKQIKELVRVSKVALRGWDYPHFQDSTGEPYPVLNGIEKCIESGYYMEFWRMTQSANFLHLIALKEDWMRDIEYRNVFSNGDELKGKKWLGILNTLYRTTEIFEFARRLALKNIFDETVLIEIKLHDLNDRVLVVDSFNRAPFFQDRTAKVLEPWSLQKASFSVTDLLNKADQFAIETFLDIVYLFGWDNPPVAALKDDQQKFLQGKI